MISKATYALIASLLVVMILGVSFYVGTQSPSRNASSGTSSGGPSSTAYVQASNRTVVATYVTFLSTPMAETPTTTSSGMSTLTTTSYATSSLSLTSGGSYTYPPSAQVKILSVTATVSSSQAGERFVTFGAQFENVGTQTMYVAGGGGSSLSVSQLSGAVTQQNQKFRCMIATAMVPLGPGENMTSVTPGCWSEYTYLLSQPGTVEVTLTLSWYYGESTGGQSGSLTISAEFTLS